MRCRRCRTCAPRCPHARIDWVVERGFAPLVQRCEGVRRVIACGLRRWRKSPLGAQTRPEWRAFRDALRQQLLRRGDRPAGPDQVGAGGARGAPGSRWAASATRWPTRPKARATRRRRAGWPTSPIRDRAACARGDALARTVRARPGLRAADGAALRPERDRPASRARRRPGVAASSWSTAPRATTSAGPRRTGSNSGAR